MTDLELAKMLSRGFDSSEQWFLDTCLRAGLNRACADFAVKAAFEARASSKTEDEAFRAGAQFVLMLIGASPGTKATLEALAKDRGLA